MDCKLFILFQEELFNEAKRIVPIVYNENCFLRFDTENYRKFINEKYKYFNIDIELFLVGLCGMKFDGEDWKNDKLDIPKSVEHHKNVLKFEKEVFGANIEETLECIGEELVNNYDSYKNETLFNVMPSLVSKYMKTHNDSVEHKAYILYLNDVLKRYGKYLPSTNLCDIQNI